MHCQSDRLALKVRSMTADVRGEPFEETAGVEEIFAGSTPLRGKRPVCHRYYRVANRASFHSFEVTARIGLK